MKTARFVLKIVAGSLALGAFVCAIIGFSDKIGMGFKLLFHNLNKAVPEEEIGIG